MSRLRPVPVTVAVVAFVAVLAVSVPAFAHVTVNPSTAVRGGYAKLTFRVPNETDNASTTKLRVFFPTGEPLGSVLVSPVPGWTFTVKKTKLAKPVQTDDGPVTEAVSQVVWTAGSSAAAIQPGEFEEFAVSAGPLPDKPSMIFKALQTYSNGQVVRWIQTPTSGAGEPAHPAPVLRLLPADRSAPAAQGASSTAASHPTSASASGSASGPGAIAKWALGVAIAALLTALAGTALRVRRR